MNFLKINFLFYLSYWLSLLLIVCGYIDSNPGPVPDLRALVLYSNIHGLRTNLGEFAAAGSDYDVLVCAESKISDRSHLSERRIPGFGCSQQRLWNSMPGARVWLFMLGKDSAPSGRASWCVLATSLLCFVFAVG